MSEHKNENIGKKPFHKPQKTSASSDKIVFYEHSNTQDPEPDSKPKAAAPGKTHHTKHSRSRKFKLSKKRVVLNVLCVIAAVLMIVTGTGCIAIYSFFNRINFEQSQESSAPQVSQASKHTSFDDVSDDEQDPDSSELPKVNAYKGTLLNDDMILNIMLFGADTRKGAETGQSDTMILFSIDTRHQKLKMLSFMRDTYVEIPGDYENQKLNASYTFGGASLAVSTIETNYGIKIDRYAVVDFKSFKKIINALGGIDIELTDEEIDYIDWQLFQNNQSDTRYELDVNDYEFYENSKGETVAKVHLNGQQALWHARNRGEDGICSGDDYTRTERQREVVSIMINNLKEADFPTVLSVIYEIGPMITTNLKTSEITSLATNIMNYLKYDIVSTSAPISDNAGVDFYYSDWDNPVFVNGELIDCIVIYDWNAFRQKVAEFVFEDEVDQTTTSE